jgi:capsular exopolysaccharide synthesis family protein
VRQERLPEFTGHTDLVGHLRTLWRWKFLFLAFVVAVPAIALAIQLRQPDTYRATALVGVSGTTVNTGPLDTGSTFSTSNISAIAELITTRPVAEVAARSMQPPVDPAQIVGQVSAEADQTTNFIRISAEDRSPKRAADIANAFARAISLNRQQVAIAELDRAIAVLEPQLARLARRDPARPALVQQLNQLRAARSIQNSNAAILQAATPSSTPAGAGLRRSVEIALLIGLLLGFGAVVLAENSDRRLRAPEELEAMAQVPLLATIAPSAFSSRLETGTADDEAFYMLRAALTYFNTERPIGSVIVASPGEKEGKTTVATRLAIAAASAGLTVILVDADLRRGQVAVRLGIDNSRPGLGAVLADERPLADVLVDYPLTGTGDGHLAVLPTGPHPSNPSALLSSQQMQSVLRRLESVSGLVIVDTPAALAVGDALPLMRSVSGVILVGRMNRSSRRAMRRLHRMIIDAHGVLLGVVATGVTRSSGYYEGYSRSYYTEANANGANGHVPPQREQAAPGGEPTSSPAPRQ